MDPIGLDVNLTMYHLTGTSKQSNISKQHRLRFNYNFINHGNKFRNVFPTEDDNRGYFEQINLLFFFFQSRQDLSSSVTDSSITTCHPEKPPKNPRPRQQGVMTQSCPTPPQARKKFFLGPKALIRSPFLGRSSRHQEAVSGNLSHFSSPIQVVSLH